MATLRSAHEQEQSKLLKEIGEKQEAMKRLQGEVERSVSDAARFKDELVARADRDRAALKDELVANAAGTRSRLEGRIQELEGELAAKVDQLVERDKLLSAERDANETLRAQQAKEPEQEDGIELLEKHLIKLSELVRQKDMEIRVLQETVHRQCLERTQLLANKS